MKEFFSKYWKRILIIIGIILIVINIVNKCIAPHTVVSDYAKYGPDVESSSVVSVSTKGILAEAKESAGMTDNVFRIAMIFAVGLLAAVIIGDITTKKAPAKKK